MKSEEGNQLASVFYCKYCLNENIKLNDIKEHAINAMKIN